MQTYSWVLYASRAGSLPKQEIKWYKIWVRVCSVRLIPSWTGWSKMEDCAQLYTSTVQSCLKEVPGWLREWKRLQDRNWTTRDLLATIAAHCLHSTIFIHMEEEGFQNDSRLAWFPAGKIVRGTGQRCGKVGKVFLQSFLLLGQEQRKGWRSRRKK